MWLCTPCTRAYQYATNLLPRVLCTSCISLYKQVGILFTTTRCKTFFHIIKFVLCHAHLEYTLSVAFVLFCVRRIQFFLVISIYLDAMCSRHYQKWKRVNKRQLWVQIWYVTVPWRCTNCNPNFHHFPHAQSDILSSYLNSLSSYPFSYCIS